MTLRKVYSEKRVDKSGRIVVIETDSKTVLREYGVKIGRQEDDGGGVEAEGAVVPRTGMAHEPHPGRAGKSPRRQRKKVARKRK